MLKGLKRVNFMPSGTNPLVAEQKEPGEPGEQRRNELDEWTMERKTL